MVMMEGDTVFLDTNILITATDSSRNNHYTAKTVIKELYKNGFHPVFSGQVIREYMVVATRPLDKNGLGLKSEDVFQNIEVFKKFILIKEDTRVTSEILSHLAIKHDLKGKKIHDANIVSTMKTHGIEFLLTENLVDFSCFQDITAYSLEMMEKNIKEI